MSAVAGIGGVLLFALMASVLEYAVLIPMYGAIQQQVRFPGCGCTARILFIRTFGRF
jgi:hypothetical protein